VSEIAWLASYPKSGNTWMRIFLANFQRDVGQPININSIEPGPLTVQRALFDSVLGVASSDMTQEEIERWRPAACRHMAARSASTLYVTTHDAWRVTSAGEPLIPADVTRGALYIVRNPLDVAVSFAHHFAIPVEEAVKTLGRKNASLGPRPERLRTQLSQRLMSWSDHVLSWLEQQTIPVHVMRYEDMSLRPVETFGDAVCFLGWPEDVHRVRRAVEFSSFRILREQEVTHGFRERQPEAASFFRQGKTGGWREVLTEEQVARIISDHGPVMRRLGYLSENGCVQASQ
jgi:aryl sulfotransferase